MFLVFPQNQRQIGKIFSSDKRKKKRKTAFACFQMLQFVTILL